MRTFTKYVMLLKVMYISLLPVLKPQEVRMQPKVVGYLGLNVTLPCEFIPGPRGDNITQLQWELQQPEGEKFTIIVSHNTHGVEARDTYLKDRVKIEEQSLIILHVEMRDAGLYTCNFAAFPGGSFEGTTDLVVQEQMPLSSGVVAAIVISVLLLLVVMAAISYLIFIRRCDSSARNRVYIDTRAPVMDVTMPSVIEREDVVYSDVKLKPCRDATPSSNDKYMDKAHADDVTYSDLVVLHQQLK